ncbi:uncharacterized protein LOC116337743 isoform X2 [Contarinia nasturtii]|uniref:uncharacterized protein LOC116337743 isoform X2 n=3 Tax=Contarinia nasturtii TaxID=265458 RepID=UPI0012D3F34C|nr:uncharacterized protein LOC116337743 isoform X2 [Contarinia nasturtii]
MRRKRAKNGRSTSLKMTLNQVLREEYRAPFIDQVTYWCLSATMITTLASLLFLFKANKAFDDENVRFFKGESDEYTNDEFNKYVNGVIGECFTSVLQENYHKLPLAFRRTVEQACPDFLCPENWPAREGMGNAFNHLITQYITNVKNNIRVWAFSRIKKFFTLRRYELNLNRQGNLITELDVKRATKIVMFQSRVERNANIDLLLNEAAGIGLPINVHFQNLIRDRWFQSIPIFINIQRQIFDFHAKYEMLKQRWFQYRRDPNNNVMPTTPLPPKIKNFLVVPIHDFDMKHIRIDIHLFYLIARKFGALKLAKGKRGQPINIEKTEYDSNPAIYWDLIFDLPKISKLGNGKEFDFAVATDSVAVSLCFVKPERNTPELDNNTIKEKYNNFEFDYVLGIDPGVRTWNATVRKHVRSGNEENITIDGPKYHFKAKYGKRKRKSDQWTELLQKQRELDYKRYAFFPSPKGRSHWMCYIAYYVKMMKPAMAVYTTRKFIRLRLDKYIEENRASDKIAASLTKKKSALVFIGAAQIAPNSPIGIKKRLRCPGLRRLLNSFKKLGNCIVRLVDEYNTSQTCAKCFRPFDRRTKSDRYKVCQHCIPSEDESSQWNLPNVIITMKSNRVYQQLRKYAVDFVNRLNAANPDHIPMDSDGLVSKLQVCFKNWQLNTGIWKDDRAPFQLKTVWHRDIVAAKNIMYKGLCTVLGLDIHPQLLRPQNQNAAVQNQAADDEDSSDDEDYVYVLDVSDDDQF